MSETPIPRLQLGRCYSDLLNSIERGDTDVNLSRLEQLAALFDMKLTDLLELNERGVLNLAYEQNQSNWHIGTCSPEYLQLQAELEKQQLLNAQKDQEIEYLKQINALLKKTE